MLKRLAINTQQYASKIRKGMTEALAKCSKYDAINVVIVNSVSFMLHHCKGKMIYIPKK